MKIPTLIFLLMIGLASSLGAIAGCAGSLVEFPNLADHGPPRLLGYLARPDAGLSALLGNASDYTGSYPAVVVLHGSGGLSSHSAKIADRLGSWGYVALTVDSLGPRGQGAIDALLHETPPTISKAVCRFCYRRFTLPGLLGAAL